MLVRVCQLAARWRDTCSGTRLERMNALTSLLPRFARRTRHERPGFALYSAAVAAGRAPYLYTALHVPDTLDGRFDLIGLHAWLLIHRLRFLPPPGPALAQAVFDAMFSDMDLALRELGVGDLSVGKRVRSMWEAFHGRAKAYEEALAAIDPQALPSVLVRNVWRGAAPPDGSAEALARLVRAQRQCLAEQEATSLFTGQVRFLPADQATL
jgi:cytochrome b pre-mRNA-processing protein 3